MLEVKKMNLKNIIAILSILFYTVVFSQSRNNKIIDTKSAIEAICKTEKIQKLNQKKLNWRSDEIYGAYINDTALFGITGILKNETVIKYFNSVDLKFVEQQYHIAIDTLWNYNFKKIKILNSLEILNLDEQAFKTHKMEYYYHSISNPLFSFDGQFMIIKIDYFCGFMCSNRCIYLFKKSKLNKSWKKISEFNCLSS
jgi:hypothetical protein